MCVTLFHIIKEKCDPNPNILMLKQRDMNKINLNERN